jgi:hypothetical protein
MPTETEIQLPAELQRHEPIPLPLTLFSTSDPRVALKDRFAEKVA